MSSDVVANEFPGRFTTSRLHLLGIEKFQQTLCVSSLTAFLEAVIELIMLRLLGSNVIHALCAAPILKRRAALLALVWRLRLLRATAPFFVRHSFVLYVRNIPSMLAFRLHLFGCAVYPMCFPAFFVTLSKAARWLRLLGESGF